MNQREYTIYEKIEVMAAFAAGRLVESTAFSDPIENWKLDPDPVWNWKEINYRVAKDQK
jgi:hypothetical protein